ncbi:phospho-N-acetylmuramoyl-pentapeptide-transferase [Candidatus Nomurabacteria bacterium]|nr:phospho-N-acetylmuramoyl-pentapeptide-transferase [Candidatus Nomurabacteria bacterium]
MQHLEQLTKNDLTDIVLLGVMSFMVAMALTPIYTYFAYRYRFWKRQRTTSTTGEALEVFTKLHAKKFERSIPTMAGVIAVASIVLITLLFNMDRAQTFLPLAALVGGACVGLVDDIINIRGRNVGVAGLRSSIKFLLIITIGTVLGWYFFEKLGFTEVWIPYVGSIDIGWLIIPLFAFIVTATGNAVNISDGLDGLAGGLLVASYGAFGFIALMQGQVILAGFCFTVLGALLSYLWFNIHPARFFMGDVGSFAYGVGLGVVAMMTNSLLLLPVIGILFVVEAGSSLIQIVSKKMFHKKVFISAPFHHHLEAIGWPEVKVTMRFWVISFVAAFFGILIAITGGHL